MKKKVFSVLKCIVCIYLTKCGFGQKINYLANCVMYSVGKVTLEM